MPETDNWACLETMMGKENRGFAAANPQRRKELAKKGSDAARDGGRRHHFTQEEAKAASEKGLAARYFNILHEILIHRHRWQELEVRGETYKVHQMKTPFWFNGIRYVRGSWLVWAANGTDVTGPKAMGDSNFHLWKIA